MAGADDCSKGPVPLAALLEERGVGSVSAVALSLSGCVLWAVEDENGQPLVALLPDELAKYDEEASDNSSDSCEDSPPATLSLDARHEVAEMRFTDAAAGAAAAHAAAQAAQEEARQLAAETRGCAHVPFVRDK